MKSVVILLKNEELSLITVLNHTILVKKIIHFDNKHSWTCEWYMLNFSSDRKATVKAMISNFRYSGSMWLLKDVLRFVCSINLSDILS